MSKIILVSFSAMALVHDAVENCIKFTIYLNLNSLPARKSESVGARRLNTIFYELPHFIRKTISQVPSSQLVFHNQLSKRLCGVCITSTFPVGEELLFSEMQIPTSPTLACTCGSGALH